jgi:hypothetical protein
MMVLDRVAGDPYWLRPADADRTHLDVTLDVVGPKGQQPVSAFGS